VNWINYKTGFKHVHFRLEAANRSATIAIELAHPDPGIRELYFEQFAEFKNILHQYLNEEWTWEAQHYDEDGKETSRIYQQENGISLFNQNDWPALISFFKPRIIALDEFWNDVKAGFEALR
jgi:hypothetical protein